MAVSALPDVFGAILSKLRATTAITALTSTRIGDEVKGDRPGNPGWGFTQGSARAAIVVQGPVGGPGELEMPLYRERYDVRCYGPNRLESLRLARTVRAALIPPDGGRVGFSYGDCYVYEVAEEAGPIRLLEPDTEWHAVVIPYLITYSGAPIS